MRKKVAFDIGFWVFLWLLFSFSFMRFQPIVQSFGTAALVIFPFTIPIYIHYYIFGYFIMRKQYILYLLSTTFLVVFFGYLIGEFQHYMDPDGEAETYGAILLFMLLYTGAHYFMTGTQQRMKIKQEEDRRANIEMELRELESKQAIAELDLLKSQVNPHFLFNSLNSIYSLIITDSATASDAVLKLSDLMRYILDSSKKRKVLVKHEIQFIENYVDLEKIRLGSKAKVSYKFGGDMGGKIISPMLLIPFVENCFKHGIGVHYSENKIDVALEMSDNTLILNTSNNIAPKRINPDRKKSGTGIENVRKRLNLLYPQKHDLEIEIKDNKYEVILKLDI
ncbi:MAG: hypothetical protein CL661_09775 [Bacteroidetes bacterium]|nr:hypothetical protein [Bacteroidota bacterium]